MADIMGTMFEVKHIDELSKRKNPINNIHPLVKLLVTMIYICVLASYDKYEIVRMLPLMLYPVIIIMVCDIPVGWLVKRVLLVGPFIVIAGIFNPILDKRIIQVGEIAFSSGWLTFASLLLKSTLMVLAGLLLISTTGIDEIARAMSIIRIPSVFILLFILTYRYIFVLTEEASRLMRAYSMRAPGQKGVKIRIWGSMVGQLLIRTFNRAQTIYQSMILKGYKGKFNMAAGKGAKLSDLIYFTAWVLLIAAARAVNIPIMIAGIFF